MAEATNGVQQMAIMMLNPQLAVQQQKFALQQAMAQKIMEQGSEQPPTGQLANPSGMVIKNSPIGGAARSIQQALGAYLMNKGLQNQAQYYQNMPQNQASQDPNAPSMEDKLNALIYGDKLGTAGYENRIAGSQQRAKSQNTLQNYNGHLSYPPAENPPSVTTPVAPPPSVRISMPTEQSGGSDKPAIPVNLSSNGQQNIDYNKPEQVKGAEIAATKGAESGTAYQDKIIEDSSHALEGKRIVEQMKENLKGFEPSKLADMKANVAAWGESLGMDKGALEAQLGNVGDVQSFKKLTANLAIQAIKQISPKATQMEFQRFLENNPNPDLNDEAMSKLIDFTGKTFDLPLQKQQAWTKWKKGNSISNYSDFDSGWNSDVGDKMPSTLAVHVNTPKPPNAPVSANGFTYVGVHK